METIAPAIDLSRAARLLAGVALVISGFFLFSWLTGAVGAEFLGRSMKLNTSLALFLCSIGLWLEISFYPVKAGSRGRSKPAVLLALVVLLIGAATEAQYLFHWSFGIDELLARDFLSRESALFPGRMSPIAAFELVMLGAILLSLHVRSKLGAALHQILGLTLAVLCVVSLVGYLFGVSALYQVGPFIRISPYTSLAILFLTIASLFLRPEMGVMKLITSQTPGGMAVRRMLPVALILPPLIGFLRLWGQQHGYYGTAEGTSISVMAYIIIFSCFIYWSGRQLNVGARDRYEAEQRFLAVQTARANELQAALRTRDEFLSIASHELKTPLTSLKLQLQMQKRAFAKDPSAALTSEKLVRFFDSSDRQVQRISRLIEDMLDVGRIHSGKFMLSPEEFDLVELVKEVGEQMLGEMSSAGSRLSLSLPASLLGRWDRIRLAQVISNLLSNAAKYGAGRPIEIKAEAHGDRVRLIVADQGEGIDPVNHRRIFERFERAVPGTHISGLGLGLFIVKQIVDLHGGWIRVDSELGKGATFTLEFPQRTA